MNPDGIKGGQGRDPEDVLRSALAIVWAATIAIVSLLLFT